MKLFHKNDKWNWVDDNNNFVGFDNYPCCCEDFGYEMTSEPSGQGDSVEDQLDEYMFAEPLKEIEFADTEDDDGGGVNFLLYNKNTGTKAYLYLYNHHNGYYAHGYDFTGGNGCL